MKCEICGEEVEELYTCERCGRKVCIDCTGSECPYNVTLCIECDEEFQALWEAFINNE